MSEREQLQEQYRTNTHLRARIGLHERFSTSSISYPRWLFDGYAFGAEADVLEVGCGDGMVWRENRDRIPEGWRLTLTDLSPGMVEVARAALADRAEYAVADVQELPFADGSFDGVIANHMLFHVADRPRALAEIVRVLRPGGLFCATAIGLGHLRRLRELVPPRKGGPWERTRERFSVESAAGELAPFFVDVELEPYDDSLEVTELEPLLDFVRSRGDVEEHELEALRQAAEEEIAARGSFHVTKETSRVRSRKP
ncbi:MAG: class I SAM-dependent methyltransferase [Gaiellaceae bacterium]